MNARTFVRPMLVLGAVAAITAGLSVPAFAVPPSDNVSDTITFVGSDTTQYFDEQFCADINANSYADNPSLASAAKDTCSNIYAFASNGGAQSEVAPADSLAAACTWYSSPGVDPNPGTGCPSDGDETAPTGSGAGNTRLLAAAAAATPGARAIVDVGRASSDQCTGKGVLTETCYAYGRDAVGWAKYRTESFALSATQLQNIYNCTITNWSQIPNAGTGVIQRYFPQTGSGTGSFFVANFLGGQDPRTTSYTACGGVSVPADHLVEENDATVIPAANRTNAIVPFSAGSWIAQVVDQPGVEVPDTVSGTGLKLGGVKVGANNTVVNPVLNPATTTPAPNPAAYNETSAYPGARYIYHDVDSRTAQYGPALHFVGTSTTGTATRSKLCNNASGSAAGNLIKQRLKQYGFLPLPVRTSDPTFWGTCRVFAGS